MPNDEHARAGAARVGGNAVRVAGTNSGEASDQWLGCKLQWRESRYCVKRSPQETYEMTKECRSTNRASVFQDQPPSPRLPSSVAAATYDVKSRRAKEGRSRRTEARCRTLRLKFGIVGFVFQHLLEPRSLGRITMQQCRPCTGVLVRRIQCPTLKFKK